MKADLSEFSPVAIEKVKAEDGMPFPLYIYLKLNNRLVPIRHENDPLYTKRDELIKSAVKDLWTPIYYYDRFKNLLELKPKCEEAQLVKDVLTSEVSQEAKAQVLTALSQDLLANLHKVTASSEEAKEEGMRKCKEIADEILIVAAAHDSVYDEILSMRQSKEDIDHSVAVGSLAVMFAMSLGIADESVLADIIMAAIFHDVGLVHVDPVARQKAESERSPAEENEYRSHVAKGIEVVRKAKNGVNERVYRMVENHHEHYDGSGYPNGRAGEQLDDFSQVLAMANWFEDLTLGNVTGSIVSPAEALDYIQESASSERQRINPTIIEQIFQFMAEQKDAFEQKKAEMAKKVEAQAEKASKAG